QSDIDTSSVSNGTHFFYNTASATDSFGDTGTGTTSKIGRASCRERVNKSNLSVLDSTTPGTIDAGDVIYYDVHVTNTGDVTLTGLSVADPLAGGSFTSAATLAPGGSIVFTVSHTLVQSDIDTSSVSNGTHFFYNTASATDSFGDTGTGTTS